ncbi:MAG: rod shape-determining protein MreD [Chloroflexales bacterium]|nr:rod shape-determining protein MreD [Chloroflexales bacterium]
MGDYRPKRLDERLIREGLLILGLVCLTLVQVSLLNTPVGFPPAIVLVFVICRVLIGIHAPNIESGISGAMRWAFYSGIALDIMTATPIGSHALALLIAAILVAAISSLVRVEGLLFPLLAVLLGTLVYETTLAWLYTLTTVPLDWSRYAIAVIIPSILLALVPTLPVFFIMRWIELRRQDAV